MPERHHTNRFSKSRTSSKVDNNSAIPKAALFYWCHCRADNVANIYFMRTYFSIYQERLGLQRHQASLHTASETMQNNDDGSFVGKYASSGGWWCEIKPATEKISWMIVRGGMYTQSSAVFKSKELPVQIIIILSNRQK